MTMAAKSDYYDILGVSKGVTQADMKKAYRKQALEWHPDKHKDNKDAAEKRFKEINEAYQILSDTEKRKAYDQFGHAAFSPGGAPASRPGGFSGFGGQSPFGGTWKVYTSGGSQGGSPFAGFDFGDPFDIFEQFFGGVNSFARAQSMKRYSISIDFMEAIEGVEKEVNLDGRKRKIKIPAGVDEGSRIRFDDFILSVDVRPHDIFERDGADIFVKVIIPYSLAVMGGQTEVPTLDGTVKIRIRSGTQSGTMMRLRGKGAPHLRGRGKGDEYVRIVVAVPEKLTREQRKLIEGMKDGGL